MDTTDIAILKLIPVLAVIGAIVVGLATLGISISSSSTHSDEDDSGDPHVEQDVTPDPRPSFAEIVDQARKPSKRKGG